MEVEDFRRKVELLARSQAELGADGANPAVFLPGEEPGTSHPEDASHWIDVYQELIEMKHELLNSMKGMARDISPSGQPEVKLDRRTMELELERLELHLLFWQQRLTELQQAV